MKLPLIVMELACIYHIFCIQIISRALFQKPTNRRQRRVSFEHIHGGSGWSSFPRIECDCRVGGLVVDGHEEASAEAHVVWYRGSFTQQSGDGCVHCGASLRQHLPFNNNVSTTTCRPWTYLIINHYLTTLIRVF